MTTTAPPAPHQLTADQVRALNASHVAFVVLPGPVGELVSRELVAWADYAHRFDQVGRGLALIADIEQRHKRLVAERTFG